MAIARSADFPFSNDQFPLELGAVVQKTVADGSMPALIVINDDDNEWLIGDGVNPPVPEGSLADTALDLFG